MFDLQAALGLHQLAKVEKHWQARKALAEKYDRALAGIPEVVPLARHPEDRHAHHLYIILVKTEELTADRDQVMAAIQAENIGVGIHFLALHTQPFYAHTYGWKRGDLPRAEYAADRIMSLPLYPTMTDDDLRDAVVGLEKVIAAYRKG